MEFKVGGMVVYPHHGAASVIEIKERVIRGEKKTYLKLHVAQGDMIIEVPAENVDAVGVRDVIDPVGLEEIFSVLREELVEEPANWSQRYKTNLDKLSCGEIMPVTEVVRDLSRRAKSRGLSAGEKRMLQRARSILVAELALARNLSEEDADQFLDRVLDGES